MFRTRVWRAIRSRMLVRALLAIVALVCAGAALVGTLHHDELALGTSAAVTVERASGSTEAVTATVNWDAAEPPSGEMLVCTLLVLCCVALLVVMLRAARDPERSRMAAPRGIQQASSIAAPAFPVSLLTLSISRT